MREKVYSVSFQVEAKDRLDISFLTNRIFEEFKIENLKDPKKEIRITKLNIEDRN
jgi:hypothetical protein